MYPVFTLGISIIRQKNRSQCYIYKGTYIYYMFVYVYTAGTFSSYASFSHAQKLHTVHVLLQLLLRHYAQVYYSYNCCNRIQSDRCGLKWDRKRTANELHKYQTWRFSHHPRVTPKYNYVPLGRYLYAIYTFIISKDM